MPKVYLLFLGARRPTFVQTVSSQLVHCSGVLLGYWQKVMSDPLTCSDVALHEPCVSQLVLSFLLGGQQSGDKGELLLVLRQAS